MMCIYCTFHDGHPYTRSLNLPHICRSVKRLKKPTLMFFWNADTVIFYTKS